MQTPRWLEALAIGVRSPNYSKIRANLELDSFIDAVEAHCRGRSSRSVSYDRSPRISNVPTETSPEGGENAFLSSLPSLARRRILRHAQRVALRVRETLVESGELLADVYFPTEGAISSVVRTSDRSAIESGLIGREGMIGFPASVTAGTAVGKLYAQIAGAAWKVPGSVVGAMVTESANALQPFLRYVDAQLGCLAFFGACNGLHSIDERFSRWLLLAHDRTVGDEITLTQESLALMLGVHRPGVSIAAAALKRAGVIDYSRGNIVVVDRRGLQRNACACYDDSEDHFDRRMGYSIRKLRIADRST